MVWTGLTVPSVRQLAVAERAIEVVSRHFYHQPLYSRVDLVPDGAGTPLVLEVELIDPYLSLDVDTEAAVKLATAISRQ